MGNSFFIKRPLKLALDAEKLEVDLWPNRGLWPTWKPLKQKSVRANHCHQHLHLPNQSKHSAELVRLDQNNAWFSS